MRRTEPCTCGSEEETPKGHYAHGCIVHDEEAYRRWVIEQLGNILSEARTLSNLTRRPAAAGNAP
jgi:hypothetical protein